MPLPFFTYRLSSALPVIFELVILAVPSRLVISRPRSRVALPLFMDLFRLKVKPFTFRPVIPSSPLPWISIEVRLRLVTPERLIPDPVMF